ncbi:MAG: hypothetical protein KH135_04120 [Firmicutes bacterium]|nr:hypothetical protein [Bacillota bacterium]
MEENESILVELKEYLLGEEKDNSHVLKEKVLSDMIDESYKLTSNISKQERLEFVCGSYFLFMMHDMNQLKSELLNGKLKEVKKEILDEFALKAEIPDTVKGEIAVRTIEQSLEALDKEFQKEVNKG